MRLAQLSDELEKGHPNARALMSNFIKGHLAHATEPISDICDDLIHGHYTVKELLKAINNIDHGHSNIFLDDKFSKRGVDSLRQLFFLKDQKVLSYQRFRLDHYQSVIYPGSEIASTSLTDYFSDLLSQLDQHQAYELHDSLKDEISKQPFNMSVENKSARIRP